MAGGAAYHQYTTPTYGHVTYGTVTYGTVASLLLMVSITYSIAQEWHSSTHREYTKEYGSKTATEMGHLSCLLS